MEPQEGAGEQADEADEPRAGARTSSAVGRQAVVFSSQASGTGVRAMPMEVLIVLAAVIFLLALGVRIVPESQRLAVMRLGMYVGLRGPGIVLVLPFIDRVTRLTLDRDIPGWRGLSEEQLREQVLQRLNT